MRKIVSNKQKEDKIGENIDSVDTNVTNMIIFKYKILNIFIFFSVNIFLFF